MQLLNLVVKNVCPTTTREELEEFFGNFGTVNNSKLCLESQLAFISFQDRESARNAKEKAPHTPFKNRRLVVNFCEPRESRRISLEEQFDKRAYERQRMNTVRSQNADLLALINSIGLLLNFSNGSNNNQFGGQMGGNFGGMGGGRSNSYNGRQGGYNNNREGYNNRGQGSYGQNQQQNSN